MLGIVIWLEFNLFHGSQVKLIGARVTYLINSTDLVTAYVSRDTLNSLCIVPNKEIVKMLLLVNHQKNLLQIIPPDSLIFKTANIL